MEELYPVRVEKKVQAQSKAIEAGSLGKNMRGCKHQVFVEPAFSGGRLILTGKTLDGADIV